MRTVINSIIIDLFLGNALEIFRPHCVQYHIAGLLAKRRCLTLPEELPIIYLWLFEGIEHVAELAVLESKHAFRLARAVSLVRFSGRNQDERARIIHECER